VYAVPRVAPSIYDIAVNGFGASNQMALNIMTLKYNVSDTSEKTCFWYFCLLVLYFVMIKYVRELKMVKRF